MLDIDEYITEMVEGIPLNKLKDISSRLSFNYRLENNDRSSLVDDDITSLVYVITRMPATYKALEKSLLNLFNYDKDISTILDVGSGPGTSYFVFKEYLSSFSLTCLEKQKSMLNISLSLIKKDENVNFIQEDILSYESEEKYDLVICSYSLNELSDSDRLLALDKLYKLTNKYLLIVEAGTPTQYRNVLAMKDIFMKRYDMSILSPCYHEGCPLINDYCNFVVRVPRNKLHRLLKEGEAPYEDEKFFYIILSKEKINKDIEEQIMIRHPKIKRNNIVIKTCSSVGIKEETIYKSHPLYKKYKKAHQGDIIN